jgi:hypothetical protein
MRMAMWRSGTGTTPAPPRPRSRPPSAALSGRHHHDVVTFRRYPRAKRQLLNMSSHAMMVGSTGGVLPEVPRQYSQSRAARLLTGEAQAVRTCTRCRYCNDCEVACAW